MIKQLTDTRVAYQKSLRPRRALPHTLAEYIEWNPKDGFKYEWVNGRLKKYEKMLTAEQFHIYDNLSELFLKNKAHQDGGRLVPELKCRTTGTQGRVPDICFVTEQDRKTMGQGTMITPQFAVEILSKTNEMEDMFAKLEEYFEAGVQIVWLILPRVKKVYVYTSPSDVKICYGTVLCSAEPVIADFALKTQDIFIKP